VPAAVRRVALQRTLLDRATGPDAVLRVLRAGGGDADDNVKAGALLRLMELLGPPAAPWSDADAAAVHATALAALRVTSLHNNVAAAALACLGTLTHHVASQRRECDAQLALQALRAVEACEEGVSLAAARAFAIEYISHALNDTAARTPEQEAAEAVAVSAAGGAAMAAAGLAYAAAALQSEGADRSAASRLWAEVSLPLCVLFACLTHDPDAARRAGGAPQLARTLLAACCADDAPELVLARALAVLHVLISGDEPSSLPC
jgi:hypothetical protein